MSDNWTWLDKDRRTVAVIQRAGQEQMQYDITLSKEAFKYFTEEDCICGMVVIARGGIGHEGSIIVTGRDDCPTHGFGDENESVPV